MRVLVCTCVYPRTCVHHTCVHDICMSACVRTRVHEGMHVSVCTCKHVYAAHACTMTFACLHVCTCVHEGRYVSVCTGMHVYAAHACTMTFVCLHVCTCVHEGMHVSCVHVCTCMQPTGVHGIHISACVCTHVHEGMYVSMCTCVQHMCACEGLCGCAPCVHVCMSACMCVWRQRLEGHRKTGPVVDSSTIPSTPAQPHGGQDPIELG